MNKDTTIYLLVSSNDKARWNAEAVKRGISLSQLIRESVNNEIVGRTSVSEGSMLEPMVAELRAEIGRVSEVANLYKSLYEKMAGLRDLQARMLNIAKVMPDEGHVAKVRDSLLDGSAPVRLTDLVSSTGIGEVDVYAALQLLIDAGEVREVPKRDGTRYEVVA